MVKKFVQIWDKWLVPLAMCKNIAKLTAV